MSNAIFFPDTQILKKKMSVMEKYAFTLYYTLMFLGVGEIAPVGPIGHFMAFILLTIAFLVN